MVLDVWGHVGPGQHLMSWVFVTRIIEKGTTGRT